MSRSRSYSVTEDVKGDIDLDVPYNFIEVTEICKKWRSLTDLYKYWYLCVEDYSGKKLTIDSDSLPSISSLVSRLQSVVNCQYMASIWTCNLVVGLL
jgi:hypothetical protein